MPITAVGRDLWANALSNANNGFTGTAASFTATTLKASGSPGWTVNAYAGQDVYVGAVVGTVLSNTSEVLTVARWEKPVERGLTTAAATPTGTPAFSIAAGATPALWMAVTANTSEAGPGYGNGGTDTVLTGEVNKSEGGLNRAFALFAHTGGTNVYTITNTFTANTHDTLPVTIAKIGVFNAQNAGRMLFETALGTTATLTSSGDSVAITDTVTGT